MVIHRSVVFLIEAIIALMVVAAFGIFIWWLFDKESEVTDAQLRGNMIRLQASAETYYARMASYDGVCSDIGVPANFSCNEGPEGFAIETRLSSGLYLCVDKKGFVGEVSAPRRGVASCSGGAK